MISSVNIVVIIIIIIIIMIMIIIIIIAAGQVSGNHGQLFLACFFDCTYSLNLYREIGETVSLLTLGRSHWAFCCGELTKPNLKIELFQTEIPWCG